MLGCVRKALTDYGVRVRSDQSEASFHKIVTCDPAERDVFRLLHDLGSRGTTGIIIVTRKHLDSEEIWKLLRAGAVEVIEWQEHGEAEAGALLMRKLERLWEVDALTAEVMRKEAMVGVSTAWLNLLHRVVESARYSDAPLLLTGESGTGKELLARAAHLVTSPSSGRKPGELIIVDCGALVPELAGSEFFGHERGAFTGAQNQREGAFALAHGGTLLLDEVGELPASLQAQLLRAIQEKTYKRVGGNVWQTTDFRLVCATNRDLEELVRQGAFRVDLYHRIAGIVLRTPPLRERMDDILPLATFFLQGCLGMNEPGFDHCVREYLLSRCYPGNVRELRQLMCRIANRHTGLGVITGGDIPEEDRPAGDPQGAWPDAGFEASIAMAVKSGATLHEIRHLAADVAIRLTIQCEDGNLRGAAKRLGITDRALQMRRAAERDSERKLLRSE